jgi:hypothetical protein
MNDLSWHNVIRWRPVGAASSSLPLYGALSSFSIPENEEGVSEATPVLDRKLRRDSYLHFFVFLFLFFSFSFFASITFFFLLETVLRIFTFLSFVLSFSELSLYFSALGAYFTFVDSVFNFGPQKQKY